MPLDVYRVAVFCERRPPGSKPPSAFIDNPLGPIPNLDLGPWFRAEVKRPGWSPDWPPFALLGYLRDGVNLDALLDYVAPTIARGPDRYARNAWKARRMGEDPPEPKGSTRCKSKSKPKAKAKPKSKAKAKPKG